MEKKKNPDKLPTLGRTKLWKVVFLMWLASRLTIKKQRIPAIEEFSFMWKRSLIDIKGNII